MIDIYQENILDHYKHPHHYGQLTAATHTATGANLSCGDELTWQLTVADQIITDAAFTAQACAICTASASLLADTITGQQFAVIHQTTSSDVMAMLGIPLTPVRLKCALLPLETLKRATPSIKNPKKGSRRNAV